MATTEEDYDYENEYSASEETSDPESREVDYPSTEEDELESNTAMSNAESIESDDESTPPPLRRRRTEQYHSIWMGTKRMCIVCCEQYPTLQDQKTCQVVRLRELYGYQNIPLNRDQLLPSQVLTRSGCGYSTHVVCIGCIRTMATSCLHDTVRQGQGYILCPFAFGNGRCQDEQSRFSAFSWEGLEFVLRHDDLVRFHQVAGRYRKPEQVVFDDQNHYLWPTSEEQTVYPSLVPSCGVTLKRVREQLHYMENSDYMEVKCKQCGVFLSKSTACNALSHCGVETCYVCGRTEPRLPLEHWYSATNVAGCPRYDDHAVWRDQGFQCIEHQCYDEVQTCQVPAHRSGIWKYHQIRREKHKAALLSSLSPPLRQQLKE